MNTVRTCPHDRQDAPNIRNPLVSLLCKALGYGHDRASHVMYFDCRTSSSHDQRRGDRCRRTGALKLHQCNVCSAQDCKTCNWCSSQILMGDNSLGGGDQQRQLNSIQARMHSLCPMPVGAPSAEPAEGTTSDGVPRRRIRSTSVMSGSGRPAGSCPQSSFASPFPTALDALCDGHNLKYELVADDSLSFHSDDSGHRSFGVVTQKDQHKRRKVDDEMASPLDRNKQT